MKLQGHTILVTGGASGIGYAMAKRFAEAGSDVIICGRRREQLEWAKKETPALQIIQGDVSTESGRQALTERVTREFPKLDVLINNAGIQNRLPPLAEPQNWVPYHQEISINLEAPIHLSMLLLPHLLKKSDAAIINVTSGLAFAPFSTMPTYCATKAALHSFTLSLRHQLKSTSVKVIEVIPPAVQTDLGGKGLHTQGVPLDAFADHAMSHIAKGDLEFGYESSETRRLATREQLDQYFANMNK